MIRNTVALLIFSLLFCLPSHALVLGGRSASVPVQCPNGTALPDGCLGAAPDGSFQVSTAFQPGDYFNTIAATPTNYMATNCTDAGNQPCRPPWNVAGVEYPVGYLKNTPRLDPNVPANLPAGCTFTFPTWGGGSPNGTGLLSCSGSLFMGDLENIELGTIGGHECTALSIRNGAAGVSNLTLKNIHFFNDSALCSVSPTVLHAIDIQGSNYTSGTISQIEMDGNSTVFSRVFDPNNSQPANNTTNPAAAIDTGGTSGQSCITIQYAYIHDFESQPILGSFGANACSNIQYSVVEGWCVRGPSCHAEYFAGGGGSGAPATSGTRGETSKYNVILRHWYENAFGPTVHFYSSTWNNPMPIDLISYNHNTQINAYIGKLTGIGSLYACAGGVPTGGTATNPTCDSSSPSGILYVTQGPAGQGINFSCSGTTMSLWQEIPGSYPIHNPPAPDIIDEFEFENPAQIPFTNQAYYPNFKLAGVPCIASQVVPDMVGTAGVINGHGGNPITQVNIDSNYIDSSSQMRNTALYFFDQESTPNPFTGTIFGGTTLLASAPRTLTTGELIYASDIAGCSPTVLGCDTVVTGGTSQASFTSSVSENIGPESLEFFINEVSITGATTNGTTTLTTGNSVLLTKNDFIYAPTFAGCTTANPTSCPQVSVTDGSATTTHTMNKVVASSGPIALNTLRNSVTYNGTINNATPSSLPTGAGTTILSSIVTLAGESIIGTGVGNCASGNMFCPTIVANTTSTVLTITPSVANVGPITMNQQRISWCQNPVELSGNVSMLPGAPWTDSWMNTISPTSPFSPAIGC
jgi:hypothetical protein